ncbi:MAG: EFR1 family ferrodoxin [Clostridia bacterium]|nr:EFR1 family ferrodoxin [Clostridia bacterium]
MVFYFSGTGNSHYAAAKIAAGTGDAAYDIVDVLNGKFPTTGKKDVTGFVFPVYYSGLPEIFKRFASDAATQLNLGVYVYSVITCGASIAAADKLLAKALGVNIDFSAQLVMPDNYVVMYNPSSKDEAVEILSGASKEIDKICQAVNAGKIVVRNSVKASLVTAFMYPAYNVFRVTKPFFADENCIGCGKCESFCPDEAIRLKDGKPEWIKKKCQHCVACINSCPVDAIQFGKKTAQRGRYCIEKLTK